MTWVTLALTAGVPLELVQRVTGHKTTDVVLKHYFRPGQEDFRMALEGAMPKLLATGVRAAGQLSGAGDECGRVGVERDGGADGMGAPDHRDAAGEPGGGGRGDGQSECNRERDRAALLPVAEEWG